MNLNLLVIYPYAPWPLDRGTYQRTFHLLKALASHHNVDFVALTEEPDDTGDKRAVFSEFCREVESSRLPIRRGRSFFHNACSIRCPVTCSTGKAPMSHKRSTVD